ncbi:MAG: nicotinate-nucleotide--dimethylbenzimidazole phosphoribosyltransferase [Bryobacteraceae bacterium]|nr:nicotinate-nucleotide--dimethylbenzimidazole phosphoribosyltransferase [Bryobacteraceae bacterium]MDW8379340.1 nicotinate-nucleotide--dimethylbenzimidazole phosphoribosyltransferase [Bryobacterales bacterium]
MLITDLVRRRLDSLTKPPASLGRLEELLMEYAEVRGAEPPARPRLLAVVCCGDHGVTAEGVSAWPSKVTRQMMQNLVRGGAAMSVLCRHFGIDIWVVDAGVQGEPVDGVRCLRLGEGTRNLAVEPAMSLDQARQALEHGRQLAREAASAGYDFVLTGEMGIGNTTPATALLCAFSGLSPDSVTGPGAGLDPAGVSHKASVIARALKRHARREPLELAACLGGFEILMLAGLLLGAADNRLPVLFDGFIAGSAALVAQALEPASLRAAFFSHRSAEPGHEAMLKKLGARPLLDLDLRLGEGTGAALAASLFQAACQLYHGMATFEEAAVSGKL